MEKHTVQKYSAKTLSGLLPDSIKLSSKQLSSLIKSYT